MASIKTLRSGAFQLCVKNKLLPKPLWATFDTREQASQYGDQRERLLAQGIVPSSLLEQDKPKQWDGLLLTRGQVSGKHSTVPIPWLPTVLLSSTPHPKGKSKREMTEVYKS